MPFYLGLDASTQSLTAILIEAGAERRAIVGEHVLAYDEAFPDYGTRHGVLPSDDPLVGQSPPLMWVQALDRLMADLARLWPREMAHLAAMSGSAQQHGSVYLSPKADAALAELDPTVPLVASVDYFLSRPVSPIWMDASTSRECRAISAALGGDAAVAQLTGSRPFERFTGPQIRKFATDDPAGYRATGTVHLVSSFLASLLAGRAAPLDPGDASGMNLMEIGTATWSPRALEATAPDLATKLPPIVPAWTVVGTIANYWQTKYRCAPAKVVVWSGDNPCSAIGTGLVRQGRLAISLGTSDTVFGLMDAPRVDAAGDGHVFGAPTGAWMGLTCFRNGSLARERIRDAYGLGWAGFSAALTATPPGNRGAMLLPWFEPEITPAILRAGIHRRDLDPADAAANVRAVVEAQMLAMANHSSWMGVTADAVHATGGAAVNREVLQVMADVMNADVREFQVTNSAAMGAALRAVQADRKAAGEPAEWDDVIRGFAEPVAVAARPRAENVRAYQAMRERYAAFEREITARIQPSAPASSPL